MTDNAQQGDWYCINCGYIASSLSSYDEVCDQCHHTFEWRSEQDMNDSITKNELSRMLLAAAQHECNSAKVAMSEGNAAGARVAMHHRWQLFGLHKFARDLFEADMIEGSYYGLIVEALDHAFDLDIRDMGAWAEGQTPTPNGTSDGAR